MLSAIMFSGVLKTPPTDSSSGGQSLLTEATLHSSSIFGFLTLCFKKVFSDNLWIDLLVQAI